MVRGKKRKKEKKTIQSLFARARVGRTAIDRASVPMSGRAIGGGASRVTTDGRRFVGRNRPRVRRSMT